MGNVWENCWIQLLSNNRSKLDLSSGDLDGSHTSALRGGEEVAYQGRKKRKTSTALYLQTGKGCLWQYLILFPETITIFIILRPILIKTKH